MDIIGHKKQQQFLKKMIDSGEIPHALLFSGLEKVGKRTIALEMISSIFGESLSDHPDFTFIEPKSKHSKSEESSPKANFRPDSSVLHGQIQIDQIRELNWRLSLKPVRAQFLGAVIDQAHLMTRGAQNCFLKTLEEPKNKSILILVTEHPRSLLSTITSRCENIKFYPVQKEEIKSYLIEKELPSEDTEEIIEVSSGRPGVAMDILEKPEKLEERRKKIKELIDISNSPLSLRFEYVKDLSQNQNLNEVLGIWLSYFRTKLIARERDFSYLKYIKSILEQIQKTIFLISTTNINPRLALEILVMKF